MQAMQIIHSESFRLFVAVLRVLESQAWRDAHPHAVDQFGVAWQRLWNKTGGKSVKPFEDLLNILAAAVSADETLQGIWSTSDIQWLAANMTTAQDARLLTNLLAAMYSTPNDGDLWTAEEASANTGYLSPVRWRDLAAQSRIFGAMKRGGTWFFPAPLAKAYAIREK